MNALIARSFTSMSAKALPHVEFALAKRQSVGWPSLLVNSAQLCLIDLSEDASPGQLWFRTNCYGRSLRKT